MPSLKYVVGSTWGRHEIVSIAGHNQWGQPIYNWKCTNCQTVYGPNTGTDISKGTGYTRCCPKRGKEKSNYLGFEDITGQYIAQVKWTARRRGLEFSITPEYLWKLWEEQDGKCIYTGRSLIHGVNASIDRIDSSIGYIKNNVQWLHKDINKIKWEYSEEYFLKTCKEIVEHTEGKTK